MNTCMRVRPHSYTVEGRGQKIDMEGLVGLEMELVVFNDGGPHCLVHLGNQDEILGDGSADSDKVDRVISEEDTAEVKQVRRPDQPTQKDIPEHEVSHGPVRSWCTCCLMGGAQNDPPPQDTTREGG